MFISQRGFVFTDNGKIRNLPADKEDDKNDQYKGYLRNFQ